MKAFRRAGARVLSCSLVFGLATTAALARLASGTASAVSEKAASARDGQHDFDFAIGTWKTHVARLQHPLTGSRTWVEYDGTSVVRSFWDGRANLVELDVSGAAGRIQGLSLRLYEPQTGRWSIHYASRSDGALSPPGIGGFREGRGEFFSDETLDGRPIRVRFVVSGITATSARYEQAFSADGGRSWEVNWVATDTRVADQPQGGR
jgi:hypothetical protein